MVESFHPSAQQQQASFLKLELDVEKRLQALVVKDRIRIKEFFLDFDKLRKGTVGEAGVSDLPFLELPLVSNHTITSNAHFKFHQQSC